MNPGAIVTDLVAGRARGLDTAAMTNLKNPVLMAVIGAAHGIKGELRVKTFTGDPLALGGYGPLFAKDGRAFRNPRRSGRKERSSWRASRASATAAPPRR